MYGLRVPAAKFSAFLPHPFGAQGNNFDFVAFLGHFAAGLKIDSFFFLVAA